MQSNECTGALWLGLYSQLGHKILHSYSNLMSTGRHHKYNQMLLVSLWVGAVRYLRLATITVADKKFVEYEESLCALWCG